MTTPAEIRLAHRVLRHELEAIRGHWRWFLALGIMLIVVGTFALGAPFVASIASVVTLGALLVAGGIAQLVGSFWTREWTGFFITLLMGVLYLVVGLMFFRHPGEALITVTLLLACALAVGGLFRIIAALVYRFPQWGWMLLGGAINLALGAYIYALWPVDSFIVLGIFVGIDLIFTGWTWVMLALAVKGKPRGVHHQSPAAPGTTIPV
jgi:uncharacterized membrane protein HdeD (DUF308 family)